MPIRKGIEISNEDAIAYDAAMEDADYYDRIQYCFKIKLNSFYGALLNAYFRFYNSALGESTTATGRHIEYHQLRMINKLLDGKYDIDFPLYENVDECHFGGKTALNGPNFKGKYPSETIVYFDTDSCYFKTYADNVDDAVAIGDGVAAKINETFQPFMQSHFRCQPEFDRLISCGREVVSPRGIFVSKKRYILHVVDNEGQRVDKLKIMGIDTKKSTLPKPIAKRINNFLESLLKEGDWEAVKRDIVAFKKELYNVNDIRKIGLPKGVNKVEYYTSMYLKDPKTRLPGHVAASIHYNEMLKTFNDLESEPIISGMKIKVFYIIGKNGRFKSLAMPTDLQVVPQWFHDTFRVDYKAHITRLVDKPMQNILTAINKTVSSEQSQFIESIIKF